MPSACPLPLSRSEKGPVWKGSEPDGADEMDRFSMASLLRSVRLANAQALLPTTRTLRSTCQVSGVTTETATRHLGEPRIAPERNTSRASSPILSPIHSYIGWPNGGCGGPGGIARNSARSPWFGGCELCQVGDCRATRASGGERARAAHGRANSAVNSTRAASVVCWGAAAWLPNCYLLESRSVGRILAGQEWARSLTHRMDGPRRNGPNFAWSAGILY